MCLALNSCRPSYYHNLAAHTVYLYIYPRIEIYLLISLLNGECKLYSPTHSLLPYFPRFNCCGTTHYHPTLTLHDLTNKSRLVSITLRVLLFHQHKNGERAYFCVEAGTQSCVLFCTAFFFDAGCACWGISWWYLPQQQDC